MDDKKTIKNPLEDIFDIEENTTMRVNSGSTEISTELVEPDDYDDKDKELENQLENIYQKAMEGYEAQQDVLDVVEGKFAARNAEVAVTFLHAALSSVSQKTKLKEHKDKIKVKENTSAVPKVVNQNLFVNRNDLLKELLKQDEKKPTVDSKVDKPTK